MDDSVTLGMLKKGRTEAELNACRDALLIIASNMYSDSKIGNSDYNGICDALIKIGDIIGIDQEETMLSGNIYAISFLNKKIIYIGTFRQQDTETNFLVFDDVIELCNLSSDDNIRRCIDLYWEDGHNNTKDDVFEAFKAGIIVPNELIDHKRILYNPTSIEALIPVTKYYGVGDELRR